MKTKVLNLDNKAAGDVELRVTPVKAADIPAIGGFVRDPVSEPRTD